jgi:spore coat-associated protein N
MTIETDKREPDRKRKVLVAVGLVAVVLAAAAIGAGTYAAFSDTETGPGGTVAAGTLDLVVGGTGTTELFNASNIVPGYTKDIPFTVKNDGTTPGTLSATLAVTGDDGTCVEPEQAAGGCTSGGNLQDQMTVSVVSGPTGVAATGPVLLKDVKGTSLGTPRLGAGESGTYTLRFTLPTSADNKVQSDSVTVSSTFNLDQST